jgi:hypothetical protein
MRETRDRSPLDLLVAADELINDVEVVVLLYIISSSSLCRSRRLGGMAYLEILNLGHIIALAVKVVRIERPNSLQHPLVLLVHHPVIRVLAMPWVEAVVSDHGQSLVWNCALLFHDVVQILIVAPAEHHIIHTAPRGIDPVLGRVNRILRVRVGGECVGVDDLGGEGTADGEGVSYYVPLPLSIEEEKQLAEIVNETCELHPAGLAVSPNSLRRLEEMLDLREGGVGVGLVDQGVEFLHRLPDGEFSTDLALKCVAGLQVVGDCLLLVLLGVEVLDAVAGILVLSELCFVLLSVECGGFVDVFLFLCGSSILHFESGFEDIDIVNCVRGGFKGHAIALVVEGLGHVGLFEEGAWCHCVCVGKGRAV